METNLGTTEYSLTARQTTSSKIILMTTEYKLMRDEWATTYILLTLLNYMSWKRLLN